MVAERGREREKKRIRRREREKEKKESEIVCVVRWDFEKERWKKGRKKSDRRFR